MARAIGALLARRSRMANGNPVLDTVPYWKDTATLPRLQKLDRSLHADVVIVGAGITGLTTAYLLAAAGKSTIVVERERCAQVDTGHTTAHLTMVTDQRLTDLVKRFGPNHAQAVWDAGLAAIVTIESIVKEQMIDCDFSWIDGYLQTPLFAEASAAEHSRFEEEAALARDLGFDADFVSAVPFTGGAGIRFKHQARFHPRRYVGELATAILSMGGKVYQLSPADEFCDAPRSVKANGHTITCDDIVIATHNPLVGLAGLASSTLFQTKLALYSSYVVAGRVPKGTVPDALFWDTTDPYHYLRLEPRRGFDTVIFGGEDHKTGQATDTEARYARLETSLRQLVPQVDLTHRWSGQVIETPDGLPYIGKMTDHQYAATGFSGNGMTFGTLSAMVITDAILGRANPWSDLVAPDRKALTRGLWDYVKENADYPYYMIRDRVAGAESRPLRSLQRGEGAVIERQGKKVAACRAGNGTIILRSAICTHMGCVVGWNAAERTWDCPCHGSRFKPDGAVISGPAETPLPPAE